MFSQPPGTRAIRHLRGACAAAPDGSWRPRTSTCDEGRTRVARPCRTRRRAPTSDGREPASFRRKPAWVGPLRTIMVRRGSTVRVRQRALLQERTARICAVFCIDADTVERLLRRPVVSSRPGTGTANAPADPRKTEQQADARLNWGLVLGTDSSARPCDVVSA
jgi:hypothetical protein